MKAVYRFCCFAWLWGFLFFHFLGRGLGWFFDLVCFLAVFWLWGAWFLFTSCMVWLGCGSEKC